MRRNLPQQPTLNEELEIIVDGSQRNGRNATPHCGVNLFWGVVPAGSDYSFIHYLALVRDRQTVLLGQLTELFMGEVHVRGA
jgi:Na+-transporting NADH:ubiquinone oxidoreductase subunit NqrA